MLSSLAQVIDLGARCCANGESEEFRGLLVTVQLYLGEWSGVAFNGLADTSFSAVELHGALDFERGRVCGISRYTDQNKPFFIRSHSIVDYLSASKRRMAVKYFLRWWCLVWNCPMIHRGFCDHADGSVRYPLPKYDILIVAMWFNLLPRFNVEDL